MPAVVKRAPAKSTKAQVASVKAAKKAVVKKAVSKKPSKKVAPKKGKKKAIKKLVKKIVKKPKVKAAEVIPDHHKYVQLSTGKEVSKWRFPEYILNAVASSATAAKKWVSVGVIVSYVKGHYPLGTRKIIAANVAKALENLVLSKYLAKKKKSARYSLRPKGLKAAPSVVSAPKWQKPKSVSPKPKSTKPKVAKSSKVPKSSKSPVSKSSPSKSIPSKAPVKSTPTKSSPKK
jgi:hypothetical protein